MKKTAVFLMLATAAVLPGCKSQETAEDIKTTEEMTADVQNNPLMKKSGNKHGIESFDKSPPTTTAQLPMPACARRKSASMP